MENVYMFFMSAETCTWLRARISLNALRARELVGASRLVVRRERGSQEWFFTTILKVPTTL